MLTKAAVYVKGNTSMCAIMVKIEEALSANSGLVETDGSQKERVHPKFPGGDASSSHGKGNTMAGQNEVVKCRSCKVAAEHVVIDGERYTQCPVCGKSMLFSDVQIMIGKQFSAFGAKKIQDSIRRNMPKGRKGGVTFRYNPTNIKDPGGAFFVEFD